MDNIKLNEDVSKYSKEEIDQFRNSLDPDSMGFDNYDFDIDDNELSKSLQEEK